LFLSSTSVLQSACVSADVTRNPAQQKALPLAATLNKSFIKYEIMKVYNSVIIFCLFIICSCKKQAIVCTGNCYPLNVNGKTVNSLTNTNVSNVPLIIYQWYRTVSRRNVAELNSNDNGIFNTIVSIDSTMFQNGYFLSLRMKDNDDYMTLPNKNDIRLYDLTTNTFSNLIIPVYPKVNLTIKLNRNQNDNFQYFQVAYYFVDNQDFFPYSILSPQDIKKTELIVPTSTDLFTKIRVTKRNSSGVSTATVDSIKCVKNGINIYTVNF
jgi:hypothetical protein